MPNQRRNRGMEGDNLQNLAPPSRNKLKRVDFYLKERHCSLKSIRLKKISNCSYCFEPNEIFLRIKENTLFSIIKTEMFSHDK